MLSRMPCIWARYQLHGHILFPFESWSAAPSIVQCTDEFWNRLGRVPPVNRNQSGLMHDVGPRHAALPVAFDLPVIRQVCLSNPARCRGRRTLPKCHQWQPVVVACVEVLVLYECMEPVVSCLAGATLHAAGVLPLPCVVRGQLPWASRVSTGVGGVSCTPVKFQLAQTALGVCLQPFGHHPSCNFSSFSMHAVESAPWKRAILFAFCDISDAKVACVANRP
jgi:hypothetical protein